jgi:uncharacterized membrane protein YhaH (DUF805 family)
VYGTCDDACHISKESAMTFVEAIKDGFGKYVTFSGRSSRSAYWYWVLFAFIVAVVATLVDLAIGSRIVSVITSLALLLPGLAVGFRRLHDVGRSAWWILIGLVPLIGAIVLLVFMLQPSEGPNRFGDRPDTQPGASTAFA